MSDNIRKSLQDLNLGINDTPISLPSELCGKAATLNRFSLIVSVVNPRKQNLRAIASQMPRIWGFVEACRGRILGNGKVLFIFQSEESMNLVLRRGPWAFNDWMLSVHRWYPNITEDEMKIIPFWIQIRGIPVLYLTNAMVSYIGNQLGYVDEVDFDETAGWAEFARVCVKWNYDMPLRFQRNFQFSADDNTILKFRFERLRNFCTRCGSLKHDVKECSLHYEDPPVDNSDDDNDPDDHNPHEEKGPASADTLQTIAPDGEIQIPGLQRNNRFTEFIMTESEDTTSPSVFEDTELMAERLRYLHNKFTKGKEQETPTAKAHCVTILESSPTSQKRKRKEMEVFYQQCEEIEDLTVLCQIRKKEKTESQGSCSGDIMDRGFNNLITEPPHGRSGGLALMWTKNVSLSKVYQDERMIDVFVKFNDNGFYFSGVYGHPVQSMRHLFWERLERIGVVRDGAWILAGDFNEIKSNSEKIGGPHREEWSFRDFRNMITSCDLIDLKSKGDIFSWVGERHNHTVKCCLDRVMVNTEWAATFPNAEAEFMDFNGSDHKPILKCINPTSPATHKPFRFDKRLSQIPEFENIVAKGWNSCKHTNRYSISDQIRNCRKAMSKGKHKSNMNAAKRIDYHQSKLNQAMESTNRAIRRRIPQIQEELTKAYRDEEIYWRTKSRKQWMKEGDRNTAYFHASTKTRYSRNYISSINDEQNNTFRGDEEIGSHAQTIFLRFMSPVESRFPQ
ncbi:uncharacterized protein LOC110227149 [Arabidopsis lyrata subsp. lyrata]|uniref:uncharacterized protein LOC110227149 n=1 Tax=Arabidopsis lyrata subsp. lyrata TaxID=81972 RepID=UPI000A29A890|nr:uncharacterized protein LOC110227149 [Arabidopsis lyrata subsp. lyrata]|eukprot:XP_020876164.1 uncharacterized protein LOC110227149 [Arabidopsis lyrata subsp. lyrata]